MPQAVRNARLPWRSRAAYVLLLFLAWAGASLAFLVAFLPFEILQVMVNRLSPDGQVAFFTSELHLALRLPSAVLGVVCLATAVGLLVYRRPLQAGLDRLGHLLRREFGQVRPDLFRFVADLRQAETSPEYSQRVFLVGVILLTFLALVTRLLLVDQPFRYDEAYTIIEFSSQPFREIISDYHLPNNHIFHSLLVGLSYRLLGAEPWSVRLPVLIAGVLLIPALYLAGKGLADRVAGLLAAGLAAGAWNLIDYSTNARGYMLLALFGILLAGLAVYLKKNLNRFGWAAFVLVSVLGFYTVPVMLYPFSIVMAWLGLSWLAHDVSKAHARSSLVYWLGSVLVVGLLTFLLYLPVIMRSGLDALVANRWVEALEWHEFIANLPVRALNTWEIWQRGLPGQGGVLLIAGIGIGLALDLGSMVTWRRQDAQHQFSPLQPALHLVQAERTQGPHRIPTLLAALLALGLLLPLQRVAPLAKVWVFLQPWFLFWSASGWVKLVRSGWKVFTLTLSSLGFRLESSQPKGRPGPPWLDAAIIGVIICLSGALAWNSLVNTSFQNTIDPEAVGVSEETALFLRGQLQTGDAVVVVFPVNYPLRYYFLRYGISQEAIFQPEKGNGPLRLLVVVSRAADQTLENVLARARAPSSFEPAAAQEIYRYRSSLVYLVPRR